MDITVNNLIIEAKALEDVLEALLIEFALGVNPLSKSVKEKVLRLLEKDALRTQQPVTGSTAGETENEEKDTGNTSQPRAHDSDDAGVWHDGVCMGWRWHSG